MTPERWRAIEELFHAASDLPAEEREALLVSEAAGDAALRAEVESLLESALVAERGWLIADRSTLLRHVAEIVGD